MPLNTAELSGQQSSAPQGPRIQAAPRSHAERKRGRTLGERPDYARVQEAVPNTEPGWPCRVLRKGGHPSGRHASWRCAPKARAASENTGPSGRLGISETSTLNGIPVDAPLAELSVEERLADAPRAGAPARITAEQACRIIALACEAPGASERPIGQWTAREVADEVLKRGIVERISPRHVGRLLLPAARCRRRS
jgi:Homeodomain-like domain